MPIHGYNGFIQFWKGKKFMKKLLAVLLAAMLFLCAAACGGSKEPRGIEITAEEAGTFEESMVLYELCEKLFANEDITYLFSKEVDKKKINELIELFSEKSKGRDGCSVTKDGHIYLQSGSFDGMDLSALSGLTTLGQFIVMINVGIREGDPTLKTKFWAVITDFTLSS